MFSICSLHPVLWIQFITLWEGKWSGHVMGFVFLASLWVWYMVGDLQPCYEQSHNCSYLKPTCCFSSDPDRSEASGVVTGWWWGDMGWSFIVTLISDGHGTGYKNAILLICGNLGQLCILHCLIKPDCGFNNNMNKWQSITVHRCMWSDGCMHRYLTCWSHY